MTHTRTKLFDDEPVIYEEVSQEYSDWLSSLTIGSRVILKVNYNGLGFEQEFTIRNITDEFFVLVVNKERVGFRKVDGVNVLGIHFGRIYPLTKSE